MFCVACATFNPTAGRCAGCGAALDRGVQASGARWRRRRAELPAPADPGRMTTDTPALPRRHCLVAALYVMPVLVLAAVAAGYVRAQWAEPAAWYARAETALAAGRYPDAAKAFAAAGGYRDAEARGAEVAVALAPYQAAYRDGVAAFAAGRYDEAIAVLSPVVREFPNDEEAAAALVAARERRAAELTQEASAAEARRDWLAAERALATLAAAAPEDATLAERLAALRRAHAPLVLARHGALYVVSPEGGDERLLTDAVPAAWPVWSPDRARVAFTSFEPTGVAGIRLFVIKADGTGLRELASDLRPYAAPVWSPDGGRIAYSSEAAVAQTGQPEQGLGSVRVVDVATGRETDLSSRWVSGAVYPSWSPTGDRLAFVVPAADAAVSFPNAAADPAPEGPGAPVGPGGEIVDRSVPTAGTGDVYIVTLATGAVTNLSAGRVAYPWRVAWSPVDERVLVYTREPGMSYDRDRARVALLDAQTGALTEVDTEDRAITMPVWSPDGRRIAYVAGEATLRIQPLVRPSRSGDDRDRDDGNGAWIVLANPISRHLTWAPGGDTLLAVAASPPRDSVFIPVEISPSADAATTVPTPLPLAFDADRRQSGAPQWGAVNPAIVPGPATVAGTALDPAEP